ncbi:transcription termination factor Rho [Nakamurella lactea]|uniref:transcription termination factor Rho n=1 Tax=Nakamurella lactea TaxID=459515 RepID=UPI00041A86C8|nr:transcription termination factor Rho [Nakamurella lactea]
MSDTTELLDTTTDSGVSATGSRSRRSTGTGLSAMVLTDLKAMATSMGIKGISAMRKGDLVAAIAARQGGAPAATAPATAAPAAAGRRNSAPAPAADDTAEQRPPRRRAAARSAGAPETTEPATSNGAATLFDDTPPATARRAAEPAESAVENGHSDPRTNGRRSETREPEVRREASAPTDGGDADDRQDRGNRRNRRNRRDGAAETDSQGQGQQTQQAERGNDRQQAERGNDRQQAERGNDRQQGGDRNNDRQQGERGNDRQQGGDRNNDRQQNDRNNDRQQNDRDDDGDGRGGRRRNRYRDRNRRGRDRTDRGERFNDTPDTEVRDDDVLTPVAGILDVLDSYAFIRTSGYLSGPNDIYVSLSQVRKNGLRRGDHVTGQVRAPRDGEQQRQKFNALVRLDTVNGQDPELAKSRPEFTKLTPLYPNERLRLETESHLLTTRVIDLVMPVGKGQRALIVSPPKAGKTMVMQAIANAITTNNPECHLMVVLVDERPEEVTDMQRSVKGEVIASTFDRPPADHTMVAELSIERAKRLVEMGRDVVVLLDSITRLGRAYNLAAPASGRILSGGVDSTALFPPKRFLGAARNIENGGSLTIFASALVETGSAGDTVIFEEFKGTGNAELKLDRRLADKRMFPAIDVDQSSTRKEDLLMSPEELAITVKLRRVLSALEPQQALELVLNQLRKTQTNIEFLMQVAKNTPGSD